MIEIKQLEVKPMMTKKDYEKFAEWLKEVRINMADQFSFDECMRSFCDILEDDNDKFNREKFIEWINQVNKRK